MANNSFKLQNQIRQTSLLNQENLRDLKKWEEDMKSKEVEGTSKESSKDLNKKPPIRSKVQEFQEYATENTIDNKEQEVADSRKKEANEYKDKGNTFVKAKDYESAVKMYTQAIELFNNDPVFYSNRSQCYLNLEQHLHCVSDASKAIELDPKSAKAYYRRMTAYEKLGEDYKALKSCRQWLDLAPEDTSAKNSYDRIHNRIVEAEKKKDIDKIRWSRLSSSSEEINFVNREPHLRSKRSLKNVPVLLCKAASPIPDSIIDRMFDNNTGETNAGPETNSKLFKSNFLITPRAEKAIVKPKIETQVIDEKKKLNETNEILKAAESKKEKTLTLTELEAGNSRLIAIPLSGPQFQATWKELSEIQRFLYLKKIVDVNTPIGKLLGAQLDSELLSEIIYTIHKFFRTYNVSFVNILKDLQDNTEISLLVMFLEIDDKKKLSELLSSATSGGDNATNNLVKEIKIFFQI